MYSLGGVAQEVVFFMLQRIFEVQYCVLGDFLKLTVHPNTESVEQATGAGDDWSTLELINCLTRLKLVGFQCEIEACKRELNRLQFFANESTFHFGEFFVLSFQPFKDMFCDVVWCCMAIVCSSTVAYSASIVLIVGFGISSRVW